MSVPSNAKSRPAARPSSTMAGHGRRRLAIATGVVCAAAATPASAIDFSAVFSLKGQSVYAPGPAVDVNTDRRLGPGPFYIGTKEYGGMVDPCPIIDCPTGVRAGANTNGNFGLNYGAKFNSGSYDLLYPVYAHINEPVAFSNAIGSPFKLGSSFKVAGYGAPGHQEFLNGQRVVAKLTTHSPTLQAYVDLDA
ncbi:MAG: hypothetical protein EOP39_26305, partial [Rubrivivax sp.]